MLDSVLELITQAVSSSTFIFCFCNLIIVIILLDLKPSISVHQRSEIPLSMYANQKQGTNFKCLVEMDTESLSHVVEVSHVMEAETETKIEDNNEIEENNDVDFSKEDEEDEQEEKEEDDDELRRRVEEFIEKVNKGWKEELLSRSSLIYEKNNNEILAI